MKRENLETAKKLCAQIDQNEKILRGIKSVQEKNDVFDIETPRDNILFLRAKYGDDPIYSILFNHLISIYEDRIKDLNKQLENL